MSKILVTGGAGFIGSHLCEKLLKQNQKVFCLDNFSKTYSPEIKRKNIASCLDNKNYTLLETDILNYKDLEKVFKANSFDMVVHLAAKAGVRASIDDPIGFGQSNMIGTLNLLEMCRYYNIKNFIFGSSSSVYGNNAKVPFSENDKVDNPISPYAATKKNSEMLCYTYHHLYGLNIFVLRFFTVFGPRNRPDMAHFLMTDALFKGLPINKYGTGTSQRDYTYVGDIVEGIIACLDKNFGFEIFNLGNSRVITLNQMISVLEKISNKKALINELLEQPGDVKLTYADISKAKKLLNWQPKTPYEEGALNLINWYRESYL